ncbi:hypothetical protein [Thermobrachium celere]|uniref:Uncharacterized protein n=1 Tax=Thermobrachium celere DSM 8682 TaxID=941824 RepID=R7RQD8_9CLOT|nr:hypothetical protein [Thermobrachium celere]CDF57498.1 hypothetical protein TCEL_01412 [Thermobrachium celere DSM 8682]
MRRGDKHGKEGRKETKEEQKKRNHARRRIMCPVWTHYFFILLFVLEKENLFIEYFSI